MRVREDDIRRENGTVGLYSIVEKPDYAVIAPIDGDRIHLVEQYRYPVSGRFWELPQGSWENVPQITPVDLARAELKEETGLTAERMTEVGHLFQAYGYSNQGFNIFLAKGLTHGEQDLDPEEIDLISQSFTFDEVKEMIESGSIKDATTLAVLGFLQIKGIISF
ncbi:ADP-ribose pyrophosphatase [Telmatospirillum siberiense]|uniref:GDP-mannose pyrophosphatase n=2 Tax=Telmatospirillum siberiense TaxID=382514 RepID=A0A2N3PPB9_9PROT|nr:ADP-ribose pyrophosphatase [Telmatospirillum siberiense]